MKVWVILGVTLLLYFVSIFGDFVQDDLVAVKGDRSLYTWSGLVSAWSEPYYKKDTKAGLYRPLTTTSLALNALVFGEKAWGFRLVNVLLYLVLVWVVFNYLKTVFDIKWAWGISLLFALLPIHTEAVNNIVGRAEILSFIFGLSSMMLAKKKKWEGSILCLLLAILSKESAIIFAVLIGGEIWLTKLPKKEKWGIVSYLLLGVVFYFLLRFLILGGDWFSNNATVVENPLKFLTLEKRLMGAISVLVMGIEKTLWPINLSYDYSFKVIKFASSLWNLRLWLGVVLFSSSVVWLMRRNKTEYFEAWGLFWLPLMVTGNLIFTSGTIMGERLWLIPSLGLLMIMALVAREGKWSDKKIRYLLLIVGFFWGTRTMVRNFDWLSQERLFLHDAAYANQSVLVKSNEAAMYLEKKDFERAQKALMEADKIYPDYPDLINNWGIFYLRTGNNLMAKEMFEKCLEKRTSSSICKTNLETYRQLENWSPEAK